MGRAFDDIRRDPWSWLTLMGWKALLAINAGELADTESIAAYSDFSRVLRGTRWFNFGIILPLALVGAWITRKDSRRLGVLYALACAFLLSVVLFYVVERYRHPVVPVILLFAAAAVAAIPEMWATRSRAALAVAACAAVVANLPLTLTHDDTYFRLGSELLRDGRTADALPLLQKAVDIVAGLRSAAGAAGRGPEPPRPARGRDAVARGGRPY